MMKVMSDGQNVVELFSVLLTEGEALELIEGLSRQLKRRKDFKFSEFGRLEVQSDSDESGESFAALIHFPTWAGS
tara:strand:- start:2858 stop:3082 length:225 start_codon:yes stop_codon:yes gene_type:complete